MNILVWLLVVVIRISDPTGEETLRTIKLETNFATQHACTLFQNGVSNAARRRNGIFKDIKSIKFPSNCKRKSIKVFGKERQRLLKRDRLNKEWRERAFE